MSETCGGNCSSCSEACSERKPESLQAQPNPKSKIGKVIAVVSGKGGVGKSTVSAMLATAVQRTGRRAGVLDADITGPSIPKAFGVSECASADEEGIYPAVTESGIQIMSVNLLLEHEDDPVLWRGPMMAVAMNKLGYKTAILDADITGPSIPQAFGLHEPAVGSDDGILPAVTKDGIKIMSINLLLPKETDPVVWRGPVVAGAVKQFWTDVVWENVDYLFVDMPPGTGDVPLTVFQSLPVDGIVIVTSPQELVSMIVAKAVRMAEMMHVPVIGLVENYSYFRCPDCGKCHQIFGKSHLDETAQAYHLPVLARLPIDPAVAEACDAGRVESLDTTELEPALQAILAR